MSRMAGLNLREDEGRRREGGGKREEGKRREEEEERREEEGGKEERWRIWKANMEMYMANGDFGRNYYSTN